MTASAPSTHDEGHAHPSDRNYVQIALILAVITAAEVAMSYIEMSDAIFIPTLMLMMVAKFFIVVAWFMHLRFDHKLFRQLFVAGVVLAVVVYMAFLTAMQVFGDDTTSEHRALGSATHHRHLVMFAAGDPADLWRFRPHPEVWALILGLALLWLYAVRRIGPKAVLPGETILTRSQLVWGVAALTTLWLASDWPVHDLGEQYLYSVHMTQHVLFQFAVAPMILLATPTWLARLLIGRARAYLTIRRLSRIVPATLLFNLVVVLSHWPVIVNRAVESAPLHYGVHVLVLGTALLMWLPVCGPLPELRFTLPVQACHLLLQTIVPTVPAGWLTMADSTVYKTYERAGSIWGMTTVQDQQIAGAIMKLGEAAVLWVLIGIIFIKFATRAQADDRAGRGEIDRRAPDADQLTWAEVERQLQSAGPAPAEPPRP